MKELIEKLKAANDAIEKANELSDQMRITLLAQINLILLNLLMALAAKNS